MTNAVLNNCIRSFHEIIIQASKRISSLERCYYSNFPAKCLPFAASNYGNKLAVCDAQGSYSYNDLLETSFELKGKLY